MSTVPRRVPDTSTGNLAFPPLLVGRQKMSPQTTKPCNVWPGERLVNLPFDKPNWCRKFEAYRSFTPHTSTFNLILTVGCEDLIILEVQNLDGCLVVKLSSTPE